MSTTSQVAERIAFWKVWTPLFETWRLDQSDEDTAPYVMGCDTAAEGGSGRLDFHVVLTLVYTSRGARASKAILKKEAVRRHLGGSVG